MVALLPSSVVFGSGMMKTRRLQIALTMPVSDTEWPLFCVVCRCCCTCPHGNCWVHAGNVFGSTGPALTSSLLNIDPFPYPSAACSIVAPPCSTDESITVIMSIVGGQVFWFIRARPRGMCACYMQHLVECRDISRLPSEAFFVAQGVDTMPVLIAVFFL